MFRRLCSVGAPTLLLPARHDTSATPMTSDPIVISDDDDDATSNVHYIRSDHLHGDESWVVMPMTYRHDDTTAINSTGAANVTGYGSGTAGYTSDSSIGFGGSGFTLFPDDGRDVTVGRGHLDHGILQGMSQHGQAVPYNARRETLRQPVMATDLGFESAVQMTPLRSNDRHIACPVSYPQPTGLHSDRYAAPDGHTTTYREAGSATFRPDDVV